MTNAEARFNKSLRPRNPEGSLGRTAQDVHLDSHTAPELCAEMKFSQERIRTGTLGCFRKCRNGGDVLLNVLRCQLTY